MIQYFKGAFGLNLLLRIHGSAVYRGMIPGLVSIVVFFALAKWGNYDANSTSHPYSVGVLVTSVSFLIIFRANQGYSRYWEACGNIHHMMSKWLDATTHTSCYHMQCDHYKKIKPPSYFDYPQLNRDFLTRDRERKTDSALGSGRLSVAYARSEHKSIESISERNVQKARKRTAQSLKRSPGNKYEQSLSSSRDSLPEEDEAIPLDGKKGLDGGWQELFDDDTSTYYKYPEQWELDPRGFASTKGGRTPALFLQELAHLSSLLNAVALSTLRNDVEGAESPLDVYEPGAPWPEVDPGKLPMAHATFNFLGLIQHFMGADRTPANRTRYNASRPVSVLGGVSDNEIRFLQMAKGPSAKTQLCWNWLSEFIIREHLAGSTGAVGAPIISRIIQFLGDGMIYYNQARKIMFIPFPFPHAQLSVFFVLVTIFAVPLLMVEYTETPWLGSLLSFFTVTCLAGLHEVSRELENPFRNVPNDIPVCTLQAMFNEGLITMFAGYHPDSFWDPNDYKDMLPRVPEEKVEKSFSQDEKKDDEENRSDVSKLTKIIEQQGKELERLRTLVEGKDVQ